MIVTSRLIFITASLICLADLITSQSAPAKLSASELKSLADAALLKSELSIAIDYYDQIIHLDPSQINYFNRANAYIKKRSYHSAITDLTTAVTKDEKFIKGYIYKAKVEKMIGLCSQSMESLQKVLILQNTHKEANQELPKVTQCAHLITEAQTSYDHKNYQNTINILNQISEIAYESTSIILLRARCHAHLKDHQSVLIDTRKILQHDKKNIEALHLRGQAYYHLGEHDNALTHYKEILRNDPEHVTVKAATKRLKLYKKYLEAADAALNEKRYNDAIESLTQAIEAEPQHIVTLPSLHLKKCDALLQLRQHTEAITACTAVITLEENNLDAYMKRGECYLASGLFQEAINDYQKAVSINNSHQPAQEGLHRAQNALKKSLEKDYYKELGVSRQATDREIKKAFRKLALLYHPDKISDSATDEEKETAQNKFRIIAEAYEVLSDTELRGKYDRGEEVHPQGGGQQQQQGGFGFPFGGFHQGFPGGGQQQFHFRFG